MFADPTLMSQPSGNPDHETVDWDLASATAMRLAPRGPELDLESARAAVRELRALAHEAVEPVRAVTGLHADVSHAAVVVDRREWIASNIEGMRLLLGQWTSLAEKADAAPAIVRGLGSRGTALQLGAVLAWMSSKVLGQYEIFATSPGRLLLVAPTIVQAENSLDVPARDFRLWVCLHEETHRVQFGAVPWLADHLTGLIRQFLDASDLGVKDTMQRLVAFSYAAVRSLRSDVDVMGSLLSQEQRDLLDDITAIMTLLEGHADFVMDEVGPDIVPSVALIRERFTERREHPGAVDAMMRKVLGMDAKLRQYSEGAAFVSEVVAKSGMTGLNRAWAGPASLPSRQEIADPAAWLARVS